MSATLDHLVVTAPALASGGAAMAAALGVPLRPGGEHARMGTHNSLLRLGASCYLEVLAVDPAATRPAHPRWFGLDGLAPGAPARLRGWVVRTGDIEGAAERSPVDLGPIEEMSRGDFRWRLTIPRQARPPLDGVAPVLIQWLGAHPAERLPADGCSLLGLEIRHPEPDRVRALLDAIGFAGPVSVVPSPGGPASLGAQIATPAGPRLLEGR